MSKKEESEVKATSIESVEKRQENLKKRMGTTSSSLKEYEQLLGMKESITLYLELFLIIVSVVISLSNLLGQVNTNIVNIAITIIIINFGRVNYPLQKHKIRDAYLAMDRLFTDLDNSDGADSITHVEYEYNTIFDMTENIPSYLYRVIMHKKNFHNFVDISKSETEQETSNSSYIYAIKIILKITYNIISFGINASCVVIYLLSDIILVTIVLLLVTI